MADRIAIVANPSPPTNSHSQSRANSASNAPPPFTPRATTFPDNDDSDSEDAFDLTPVESPGGPQYDDLPPPSYDEAQRDAQNGVGAFDLNRSGGYQVPRSADVRAHRVGDGDAEQLGRAEGNRRNLYGGVNVPVRHVEESTKIPVGRIRTTPAYEAPTCEMPASTTPGHTAPPIEKGLGVGEGTDQRSVHLISAALEFTRHEPDEDVRLAPRLTRCVAIPPVSATKDVQGKGKAKAKDRREYRKERMRRGDFGHQSVPGQWPDASSVTLSNRYGTGPIHFLRAYAKALHTHSIRPAEFLDFLDGLNALCALSPPGIHADIVRNYIDTSNAVFFAPRGLRVSLKTLSALLDAAAIPEERGQRAGAAASVLDEMNTAEGRARALHPWIEALELGVPEMSGNAVMVRAMVDRFRQAVQGSNIFEEDGRRSSNECKTRDPEKAGLERQNEDPPHSIPGAFPEELDPAFGGRRGRFGGRGGFRGRGGSRHGPFGSFGNGSFGPPTHGPFGAPGRGAFGPTSHGPFGPLGRGGPFNRGFRPSPSCGPDASNNPNDWAAWGQHIGKWGEEFGLRMGAWGEEFGRRAEEWGKDFGRSSEAWGDHIAGRAKGVGKPSGTGGQETVYGDATHTANVEMGHGHASGVMLAESRGSRSGVDVGEKHGKTKEEDYDDDDDASSISSDSDSDSDSEDSDLDDVDLPDPEKAFLERIRDINATAESSREKGKRPSPAIERERALAIEKAEKERLALESKRSKHHHLRNFRANKRELRKEWRGNKRELRERGLGKKSKEWKVVRKAHKAKMKVLKKKKRAIRRELKESKWEKKRSGRDIEDGSRNLDAGGVDEMVWVIVENLD